MPKPTIQFSAFGSEKVAMEYGAGGPQVDTYFWTLGKPRDLLGDSFLKKEDRQAVLEEIWIEKPSLVTMGFNCDPCAPLSNFLGTLDAAGGSSGPSGLREGSVRTSDFRWKTLLVGKPVSS